LNFIGMPFITAPVALLIRAVKELANP